MDHLVQERFQIALLRTLRERIPAKRFYIQPECQRSHQVIDRLPRKRVTSMLFALQQVQGLLKYCLAAQRWIITPDLCTHPPSKQKESPNVIEIHLSLSAKLLSSPLDPGLAAGMALLR
jgi:hypothetical protein